LIHGTTNINFDSVVRSYTLMQVTTPGYQIDRYVKYGYFYTTVFHSF